MIRTIALTAMLLCGPVHGSVAEQATSPAGHRHFVYPLEIQQARSDCFRTEREARGIPGAQSAYVAWWNANAGTTERAAWSAAYAACKDQHELPGGQWNWDAMIEVQR